GVDLLIHLVELALDDAAHLVGLAAELAHEFADASGELGEALGAEHQEGRHRDEDELAGTDIEHQPCKLPHFGMGKAVPLPQYTMRPSGPLPARLRPEYASTAPLADGPSAGSSTRITRGDPAAMPSNGASSSLITYARPALQPLLGIP